MKSQFTRLCILAGVWMIMGSSMPARHVVPEAKRTFYYWYWADNDTYLAWADTSTEITDLENMTGQLVNTQPGGGTLVAAGYTNNNYPHTIVPAIKLYTH